MNIVLIRDQIGITEPEHFCDVQTSLLDWAIEYFGPDGPGRKVTYYECLGDENREIPASYTHLNANYDNVLVVINPAGIDPVTLSYIYLAVTVAAFVLIKPPKLENQTQDSDRKQSPNNGLDAQTNLARRLQRIPEIFGKVKSYPDLIAGSIFKYQDQLKVQTEVFCIGRGFYSIDEFKSGDTLITEIPEASLEVFEPFEPITNFEKVANSSSVVDVSLLAPNESGNDNYKRRLDWEFTYDSVEDTGIIVDTGLADGFSFLSAGDTVVLEALVLATTADTAFELDGTYTVLSATDNEVRLQNASVVRGSWAAFDLVVSYSVSDNSTLVRTEDAPTTFFTVPGSDYSKILVDLECPRGMATGDFLNQYRSVDIDVSYQQLINGVATGPVYTETLTVSGNSSDALFFTFEITSNVTAGNDYQISLLRTTDTLRDETSAELVKWTRLATSKTIDGSDSIGTTRARLTLTANEQSINIQDRRFNCVATRKCQTYSSGSVVGNTSTGSGLVASEKFADAFLTYFLDSELANKAQSNLDIAGLYSIQSSLSADKTKFSFTFDNDSSSAQEELYTIADAARCYIIKSGGQFSVHRDASQASPKRLINRALKKPDSERKSINLNLDTNNDGVELTYLDFDSQERKTIILPDQLPSSDPFYGRTSSNPLKIDAVGITNLSQAWDRAQYEFRRIVYRRASVIVTLGASIATLPLNSRVEYADGTLPADIVGESEGFVKAISGLEITTSEECEFEAGEDHEVYFNTETGGTQGPYLVEPLTHTFGFRLLSTPAEGLYIRGQNDYQRGSVYTFRALSHKTNSMLLQRKTPVDDFYWEAELINYADEYFAADDQEPPSI
jgi:hypothetical protein